MITTPHQKYQQSSIQTASPGKLIIMLYDGAIRFVKQSIDCIDKKDIVGANQSSIKAQNVIHELIAALNFDYPIAKELATIYEYMLYQLIQSNMHKNSEPAAEVLGYLIDLKGTWLQASVSAANSN